MSIWSSSKAFGAFFVKAVILGGKDVTDSGFSVGGGAYSLDVVIGANGATVDGVVVDDKSNPASDTHVVIVPDATHRQRRDLYHTITTDDRGHFSLIGLNPGEYQLFAADEDAEEDDVMDPEFIRTHESLAHSVELKEGDHKSVELKAASSID
jgi:hypothetical protein